MLKWRNAYEKTILTIILCGFTVLGLIECTKEKEVSVDELNNINDKIIDYFQTNGVEKYENYSYNYVDEESELVIVELDKYVL